jgi:hypothetical protein
MFTPQHRKALLWTIVAIFVISVAYGLSPKRSQQDVSVRSSSGATDGFYGGIGEEASGGMVAYDLAMPEAAPAPSVMGRPSGKTIMPYEPTAGTTAADVDQKIIKNGYLQLSVEKVSEVASKITEMSTRRGGFLQNSSVTQRGDGTYYGDISVRVPAKEFEAAMNEMKSYAKLVTHETASGQDVTEQYTDLEAQLRNARAQEETYLAILKQARTVEDTLMVQDRLGAVRSQIESLQGRLQYLENVTAFSTINASLSEEPTVRLPTREFRPFTIVKQAFQTLVAVFQNALAGLIWFVIVWGGVLLPLGLVAWLVWKWWKRRSMNKR